MSISDLINTASATKVSEGFHLMKYNNLPHNRFIQVESPFNQTNSSPGDIIDKQKAILTASQVKEFMAVSTLLHCMDGWTYLNNSVNAFLNGDLPIAIHLAYYAELRAAISFLASEGVLIANNKQICLKENDELCMPKKGKGTHTATWEALDAWINNNIRSNNSLQYFSYKGRTFSNLIQYIPNPPATPAVQSLIIKGWLKNWSLDIEKYKNDRDIRNSSSYNPNIKRNYFPISPTERLKDINNFWKVLDPSISAFSNLDLYLFSTYLQKTYENYLELEKAKPMDKSSYIELFFKNAGLTNDNNLIKIFTEDRLNSIIEHAKDSSIDGDTGDVNPLGTIARAILLLRYATGACAFHLKKNNIVKNDLSFYFDEVIKDSGMCDTLELEDFKSLWDDIFLLCEYFDEYLEEHPNSNIFKIRNELGEYVNFSPIYTQFSRASLWGLGI